MNRWNETKVANVCRLCDFSSHSPTAFRRHEKRCIIVPASSPASNNVNPPNGVALESLALRGSRNFRCKKCDFVTDDAGLLSLHQMTAHCEYVCSLCEHSCRSQRKLLLHYAEVHKLGVDEIAKIMHTDQLRSKKKKTEERVTDFEDGVVNETDCGSSQVSMEQGSVITDLDDDTASMDTSEFLHDEIAFSSDLASATELEYLCETDGKSGKLSMESVLERKSDKGTDNVRNISKESITVMDLDSKEHPSVSHRESFMFDGENDYSKKLVNSSTVSASSRCIKVLVIRKKVASYALKAEPTVVKTGFVNPTENGKLFVEQPCDEKVTETECCDSEVTVTSLSDDDELDLVPNLCSTYTAMMRSLSYSEPLAEHPSNFDLQQGDVGTSDDSGDRLVEEVTGKSTGVWHREHDYAAAFRDDNVQENLAIDEKSDVRPEQVKLMRKKDDLEDEDEGIIKELKQDEGVNVSEGSNSLKKKKSCKKLTNADGEITQEIKTLAQCPVCDFTSNKFLMSRHMTRAHHGLRKCSLCAFLSHDMKSMIAHSVVHRTRFVHACTECAYASVSRKNFSRHRSHHETIEAYRCCRCTFSSGTEWAVRRHIGRFHPVERGNGDRSGDGDGSRDADGNWNGSSIGDDEETAVSSSERVSTNKKQKKKQRISLNNDNSSVAAESSECMENAGENLEQKAENESEENSEQSSRVSLVMNTEENAERDPVQSVATISRENFENEAVNRSLDSKINVTESSLVGLLMSGNLDRSINGYLQKGIGVKSVKGVLKKSIKDIVAAKLLRDSDTSTRQNVSKLSPKRQNLAPRVLRLVAKLPNLAPKVIIPPPEILTKGSPCSASAIIDHDYDVVNRTLTRHVELHKVRMFKDASGGVAHTGFTPNEDVNKHTKDVHSAPLKQCIIMRLPSKHSTENVCATSILSPSGADAPLDAETGESMMKSEIFQALRPDEDYGITGDPKKEASAPEKAANVAEKAASTPEKAANVAENAANVPEKIAIILEKVANVSESAANVLDEATNVPQQAASVPEKAASVPERPANVPENAANILENAATSSVDLWMKCAHCDFATFHIRSLQRHLSRTVPNKFPCGFRPGQKSKSSLGISKSKPIPQDKEKAARTFAGISIVVGALPDGLARKKKKNVRERLACGDEIAHQDDAQTCTETEQKNHSQSSSTDRIRKRRWSRKSLSQSLIDTDEHSTNDNDSSEALGQSKAYPEHDKLHIERILQRECAQYHCSLAGHGFHCTCCDYETAWKGDIKKHLLRHHSAEASSEERLQQLIDMSRCRPNVSAKRRSLVSGRASSQQLGMAVSSDTSQEQEQASGTKLTKVLRLEEEWALSTELEKILSGEQYKACGGDLEKEGKVRIMKKVKRPLHPVVEDSVAANHPDVFGKRFELGEQSKELIALPNSLQDLTNREQEQKIRKEAAERRCRRFKCSVCSHRSNWKWDLKKHIKAKHPTANVIKLSDAEALSSLDGVRKHQVMHRDSLNPVQKVMHSDALSDALNPANQVMHRDSLNPAPSNPKRKRVEMKPCGEANNLSSPNNDNSGTSSVSTEASESSPTKIRHLVNPNNNAAGLPTKECFIQIPSILKAMKYGFDDRDKTTSASIPIKSEEFETAVEAPTLRYITELEWNKDNSLRGWVDQLKLKRFQCSQCSYRTNYRGDVKVHFKQRHGGKKYDMQILAKESAADTIGTYKYRRWNENDAKKTDAASPRKTESLPPAKVPAKRDDEVRVKQFLRKKVETRMLAKKLSVKEYREASGNTKQLNVTSTLVNLSSVINKQVSYENFDNTRMKIRHKPDAKCCDICPFTAEKSGHLKLHMSYHQPQPRNTYTCNYCPFYVRTARLLDHHLLLHLPKGGEASAVAVTHQLIPDYSAMLNIKRKYRYICDHCPYATFVRNDYWLHRRNHFEKPSRTVKCEFCPYWAEDERVMMKHAVLHASRFCPRWLPPAECLTVGPDCRDVSGNRLDCRCFFAARCGANATLSLGCGSAIQCPYCCYTVCSVALMREHFVFHISFTDAAKTQLFDVALDSADEYLSVPCRYRLATCNGLDDAGSESDVASESSELPPALELECELLPAEPSLTDNGDDSTRTTADEDMPVLEQFAGIDHRHSDADPFSVQNQDYVPPLVMLSSGTENSSKLSDINRVLELLWAEDSQSSEDSAVQLFTNDRPLVDDGGDILKRAMELADLLDPNSSDAAFSGNGDRIGELQNISAQFIANVSDQIQTSLCCVAPTETETKEFTALDGVQFSNLLKNHSELTNAVKSNAYAECAESQTIDCFMEQNTEPYDADRRFCDDYNGQELSSSKLTGECIERKSASSDTTSSDAASSAAVGPASSDIARSNAASCNAARSDASCFFTASCDAANSAAASFDAASSIAASSEAASSNAAGLDVSDAAASSDTASSIAAGVNAASSDIGSTDSDSSAATSSEAASSNATWTNTASSDAASSDATNSNADSSNAASSKTASSIVARSMSLDVSELHFVKKSSKDDAVSTTDKENSRILKSDSTLSESNEGSCCEHFAPVDQRAFLIALGLVQS